MAAERFQKKAVDYRACHDNRILRGYFLSCKRFFPVDKIFPIAHNDPMKDVQVKDAGALDPARKRLQDLVKAAGTDLKALSLRLGKNPTYLQQYITKGSPQELRYEHRVMLAEVLRCNADELSAANARGDTQTRATISIVAPQNRTGVELLSGHATFAGPRRDLPILGYVKAGGRGFFIGNGERQGVTVRPEALRDVTTAYAVRVHDESMSPVLEPGYLLFVDPTRPVRPNDTVIIQLADGQTFVKRLVRRTEKAMICRQFNPATEVKYEPAKVTAVHLVVQVSMIDM